MKELRPSASATRILLLAATIGLCHGQNYQVYFPGEEQQRNTIGPNEVLGNYFNGQQPTSGGPPIHAFASPSAAPIYTSSQPAQQYTSQPQGPPQYQPFTNNPHRFAPSSVPQTSSPIPRQTHFFGNNYDFFRQFHDVGPQQPSFRPSQQTFGRATVTPSSPTASSPFTTTQFFNTGAGGGSQRPFSFSQSSLAPTSPSYTSANTITYPLTLLKQQPHQANAIQQQPHTPYNGYEEAAKALGITHGLRVITTETLKANPTVSIPTAKELAIVKNEQRVEISTPAPTPSVTSTETVVSTTEQEPTTTVISTTTTTTEPPPRPTPSPSQAPIIRNTGRSVARIRTTTTLSPTPSEIPQVIVVNHDRQPLFNRDVPQYQNSIQERERPRPQPITPTTTPRAQPAPTPRAHQQPSPPAHYQFQEGHGLYNANHLNPGQLYQNTNGAYQAYYNGGEGGGGQQGLEEIVPQIIELNIPSKMIPVLEEAEGFDPFRGNGAVQSFDPFGFQQQRQVSTPQQLAPAPPAPPVIIVTEAPVEAKKPVSTGEVYRVGPKGRLLKKRRRLITPKPDQPKEFSSNNIAPVVASVSASPSPFPQRPVTEQQRPTTYRPAATPEEEEEQEQGQEPVTTYRSRFRYTPSRSTTARTQEEESAPESPKQAPAPVAAAGGDAAVIQSRLRSLERQIRFKNRNKSS